MSGINGLPGGGPWAIDPECQARNHNSLAAAKGGGSNRGNPCCLCPRAKFIRRAEAAKYRQRYRDRMGKMESGEVVRGNLRLLVEKMPQPVNEAPPAMPRAVCRTERGTNLMMRAFDAPLSYAGQSTRDQAKTLCAGCPERFKCAEYVADNEFPAGSWGGVWAGKDPWNRAGYRIVPFGRGVGAVKIEEEV